MDIPARPQSKILIHCPQCRGEIEFLEEAHVIRCTFCGSSLLVTGREGVLRYVLSPKHTDPRKAQLKAIEEMLRSGRHSSRAGNTFLFYAPFWRTQGNLYRWTFGLKPLKFEIETGVPDSVERVKGFFSRKVDHTTPAFSGLELGLPDLGVRPQAQSLNPFSQEHLDRRDSFLPVETTLEGARAKADPFADLLFPSGEMSPEVILERVVGMNFSLLYFPLWCVECVHEQGRDFVIVDAVGQSPLRVLSEDTPLVEKLRRDDSRKSFEFSELRFLPFRCPNCGWEFPFRPFSVLHFCPTCRRLFREANGAWVETAYGVVSAPRADEGLLWVPFWRCRGVLESSGDRLENMAALYRLAPPPRAVNTEKETRRLIYFYIPAARFRNPQTLHTLGSRLTFTQPDVKIGSFEDGGHPLTAGASLPERDAQEMGAVIVGSMIPQGNRKARAWIKNCRVELLDPRILYFPFYRMDLFWKETNTGVSFQHNLLGEELPEATLASGNPK